MQALGHREATPSRVRRVVRDAEYSWGVNTMMNLYSGTTDPFSHRCRIVLYEKGMDFQVIDVDLGNKPEDLAVINPYNRVPVLVEADVAPAGFLRRVQAAAGVLAGRAAGMLAF